MYFFRSRYYNAATYRFLEPDTIVPDPKNPQALNRFSYALDNPLKLVDPSGHYVEFVGGFDTDQRWDRSAFANIIASLQKQGMKEGQDYGFFNWGNIQLGPVSLGQQGASMFRTAGEAAKDLAKQIANKHDITLIGHSKGGNVVLEYLAEVAEGGIAANRQLRSAVVLGAPLNNAFAVAANASVSPGRLTDLQKRLGKRGVNAGIYDVSNPLDRVNAPIGVPGLSSIDHSSGQAGVIPDRLFPMSGSNHLAELSDPFDIDLALNAAGQVP